MEKWYNKLPIKFPDIRCHQMIIMPNHFHCIVENTGSIPVGADPCVCPPTQNNSPLGIHSRPGEQPPSEQPPVVQTPGEHALGEHSPGEQTLGEHALGEHSPGEHALGEQPPGEHSPGEHALGEQPPGEHALGEHALGEHSPGEHMGSPLRGVVQWFKTMTTNEYIRGVKNLGWQPFDGKLWQRNYYEHIIRNERAYQYLSEYIRNNPEKWDIDTFYEK
ncbi:MAG: hypothetical protein OEW75_11045 [Cyclobacteriaceae bacterium]|nr:hypothetical protein [Cyclobacteriaceae bacterium]